MLKKMWVVAGLVIGTAGLFGPQPAAAQSAPVPVVLSGTSAPAGGTFDSLGAPVVNNAGQVAFYSTLTGGSSTGGLFLGTPGAVQTVALQGTAAPSGGNYQYLNVVAPVLNGSGQVAFFTYLAGSPLVQGIYSGAPGSIQTVAVENTPAPAGGNYGGFSSPRISNSGQVTFLSGGAPLRAVFAGVPGAVQTVALQGTAAPAGGNFLDFFSTTINAAGRVAIGANLTGGSSSAGIFVGVPGALQMVMLDGTAAPAGGNYNGFWEPRINGLGQVVFSSNLTGGSSTQGVFVGAPGAVQAVALQGTAAPAGGNYNFFKEPRLNGSGQVAFHATLSGGSSTEGIFVGAPGAIQVAALQGTAAPAGGVFNTLDFPSPTLNGSGQIAFAATLTGTGVTNANDRGLYAGRVGSLVKVVREGDIVDIGGGNLRTIADGGIGFNYSTGDGGSVTFSDTGYLAYSLRFTDGSSGVFVSFIPVPEPATIGWVVAGLAALGGLRRRVCIRRRPGPVASL